MINRWLLYDNVFRDLGAYLAAHTDHHVSINLRQPPDFHTSRLISWMIRKQATAVRPLQIKFEVTKHAFQRSRQMTPIDSGSRKVGYEVAIDDDLVVATLARSLNH